MPSINPLPLLTTASYYALISAFASCGLNLFSGVEDDPTFLRPLSYLGWATAGCTAFLFLIGLALEAIAVRAPKLNPHALHRTVGFFLAGTVILCSAYDFVSLRNPPPNLLVFGLALLLAAVAAMRRYKSYAQAPDAKAGNVAPILAVAVFCVGLADGIVARINSPSPNDGNHGGPGPDVFVIVADTLKSSALSCYNPDARPTPFIDGLAADSVVFDRAISPSPWTLPSMVSIMTGLAPQAHQTNTVASVLPKEAHTLAERLRDSGYRTGAFGHNGFLMRWRNLSQGFDTYNFTPRERRDRLFRTRLLNIVFPWALKETGEAKHLNRFALHWLEDNSERRLFLWMQYFDVHLPYDPNWEDLLEKNPPPGMTNYFNDEDGVRRGDITFSEDQKSWVESLYLAEVHRLDRDIGDFLAKLKALGLYDDAIIIFTSDHGEEMWEHGGFEHGHTLYDELIRVPFFVKLPGSKRAGERMPHLIAAHSIMPTVLEYCGVMYDPAEFSVPTIRPLLEERYSDWQGQPVFSMGMLYSDEREGVTTGRMKYVRWTDKARTEELFDLEADPNEQNSLTKNGAVDLEPYRKLLAEHAEKSAALGALHLSSGGEEVDLRPETIESLQGLGYLGGKRKSPPDSPVKTPAKMPVEESP